MTHWCWLVQGKLDEAAVQFKRAMDGYEATLGPTHPATLASMNNMAATLHDQNNLAEAEPLYRRVLHERESTLGSTHPGQTAPCSYESSSHLR